jgi:hypothetical protein
VGRFEDSAPKFYRCVLIIHFPISRLSINPIVNGKPDCALNVPSICIEAASSHEITLKAGTRLVKELTFLAILVILVRRHCISPKGAPQENMHSKGQLEVGRPVTNHHRILSLYLSDRFTRITGCESVKGVQHFVWPPPAAVAELHMCLAPRLRGLHMKRVLDLQSCPFVYCK